jgi:hypothetical protein
MNKDTLKKLVYLILIFSPLASTGCSTGASDLKLQDVPKDNGVFFGHVDFYNGQDKIDGSSVYKRCFISFENERGDTVAKISTDESSWIFASVPTGRIYLAEVLCNAGFLKTHPQMSTKELYFPVVASNPTYFGHLTIYFDYHGTNAGAMFGLVGAVVEAASESGSKDTLQIKVENKLGEAKLEYEKRYHSETGPANIVEAVIVQPTPKTKKL